MNINEAYEFIMYKVDELKKLGVDVSVKECKNIPINYNEVENTNRLTTDKWVIISFTISREGDLSKVLSTEDDIEKKNIRFGTGYGNRQRDWKLDYSFKIIPF